VKFKARSEDFIAVYSLSGSFIFGDPISELVEVELLTKCINGFSSSDGLELSRP
jgi:hypothetical protein